MNEINSILDIAKLLKQGEEQCQHKHWEEVSKILQTQEKTASEYDARAVVESNFKTKKKNVLLNAINLVEAFKWRFDNEVVAPIACTEVELQKAVCKKANNSNIRKVSRTIENLVLLKILKVESKSNYKISQAKTYSFNQFVYSRLLVYANSKYQISIHQSQSLSYHILDTCRDNQAEDTSEDVKFDESRVRICKRMKLDVTGVSLSRIESVLNARYPQFLEGKKIAAELNKRLPIEEQIKWQWHLELKHGMNGKTYLTKIGFRASNMICSYKKRENDNPCYRGKWRHEYLTEVYGSKCGNYDFNASIWRLSYNLLHDEMLPESLDGYELAYGGKFKSDEDRDIFKKIAMRLYFGGINQLGVQVERKFKDIADKLGKKYVYDRARARFIKDIMSEQKLLAIEKIGGFFDSEIFLHESCIYLNIYKDIVDSGVRCTQIYDSFYFKADYNINVNQLYKTHLSQYKSKFADTFSYLTVESLCYHILDTCRDNQTKKTMKRDNSDIPDEPEANPLAKKLENILDKVVKKGEMGLFTANKISRELHLGRTWTFRDQPTGFCFSKESREILKAFNMYMPQYKRELRIED